MSKSYTIISTRSSNDYNRTSETTGTLDELREDFSYILEVGKSYEHEKGNYKIEIMPKTIKTLVEHLNKSESNRALNGIQRVGYKLKTWE